MRIQIEKSTLAARLATAARVTSRGQGVYHALVLHTLETALVISATDGNMEFFGTAPATVNEPGEVAVNGKLLHGLVKALPSGTMTMETDGSGSLVLRAEKLDYTLAVDAAWDTKSMSSPPQTDGWNEIPGAVLCDAIDRVLFCVGRDPEQEGVSCLKFDPEPGSRGMALVGLDGHQLARLLLHEVDHQLGMTDAGLLLQRGYVEALRRWLHRGPVFVAMSEKRLRFRADMQTGVEDFSLPISAFSYPQYKAILAKAEAAPSRLEAGREALLAALDRLALFTTDELRGTIVRATSEEVTLSANAKQGKAREILSAEFSGDAVRVVLPVHSLAEILRNLSSERVRLDICGPGLPCLITGLGDADADYSLILMPIMTNETED